MAEEVPIHVADSKIDGTLKLVVVASSFFDIERNPFLRLYFAMIDHDETYTCAYLATSCWL